MTIHGTLQQDSWFWNRKIVTFYWLSNLLVFLCLTAGFIGTYIVRNEPLTAYLRRGAWQLGLMFTITMAAEAALRRFRRLNDYAVITCSVLYAIIIVVTTNMEVRGINVVVVLPVFVSMFYFEARKLLYGCSVTLVFFLALYALYPPMRHYNNYFDLLVVAGLLVGICTMGFLIMNRGITILNNLERTLESEKKLLVQTIMMDKLTKTDVLTELYNHGTFHNYLSNLVEQYERVPFAFQLALVDIDNFKQVNDTRGHWTGDLILKKVAYILKQHLGSNDFAARYGGEEFAVLLLERSLECSRVLMEEIRMAVAAAVYEELPEGGITVSIGLHGYGGEAKELFFKRADESLYAAKRTGKNKTIVFAASPCP